MSTQQQQQQQQLQKLQLQQQALLMQQKMQETIQHLTDLCWEKCVKHPGTSLSSSEQRCFSNCALRYRDVSQIVLDKLTQQQQ